MAVIDRRSIRATIPASTTLGVLGDLDGSNAGSLVLDVSGTSRVLIVQQVASGADGTAGIDTIVISKDGGGSYAADPTLLALASNDLTGTVVTTLNAAGVEPLQAAVFKSGPHEGPTLMKIQRKTSPGPGTTWVTNAPLVIAIPIT